jgi:glycosyltransferase involved in cell wall biosynthesis
MPRAEVAATLRGRRCCTMRVNLSVLGSRRVRSPLPRRPHTRKSTGRRRVAIVRQRGADGAPGSVVEICDYHGPYPGSFIPTLLAVGAAVRERLDLDYRLVFPEAVARRPWVETVRAAGFDPVFVPTSLDLRAVAVWLTAYAREHDARLIRAHFTRFDLPAGVAGRRAGARTLWHVHSGRLQYGARERVVDLVKVRTLARVLCDRVIAVSDESARECRARGYRDERVSVALNGIDIERFAPNRLPSRASARAELALPPDDPVILGFCWSPYRKGADVIARALEHTDALAVLVGGPELVEYLAAVNAPPERLRVIPFTDDTRALFAAADVFVSASREDAFSYALGEAMAAGLPVASSDIPGPAMYFDAPGLRRFPSEDAKGLAAALRELLRADLRAERGAANRVFVSERLSLSCHVARILEIFENELVLAGSSWSSWSAT